MNAGAIVLTCLTSVIICLQVTLVALQVTAMRRKERERLWPSLT